MRLVCSQPSRRLSPVGEPIALQTNAPPGAGVFPEHYEPLLLNSGTAALSLAMTIAAGSAETSSPEVILPAYGCPDLLAAAYYAGLRPVLVSSSARVAFSTCMTWRVLREISS